jgi:PilZ domain-containing protein
MQQRLHSRVRLRLPVRLRWAAPLGQQSEVCETRNVSRGGLLVACHKHHAEGFPLWVTFPFDAAAPETQPEVLARVVRSQPLRGTDADREGIAVHFEGLPRATSSGSKSEGIPEAKNGSSRSVALPIRVRPRHILWHEEAMTIEVSPEKIRFLSNREYTLGETLLVTFANDDTKPWLGGRDIPAQIVNVEKVPLGTSLVITLKRFLD